MTSNIPAFLPVAIGSAGIRLQEQVGAYSVFPNDGILIKPHVIRRVVQADGLPLKQVAPEVKQVIDVDTARTMMKLLQAVTHVRHGRAGRRHSEASTGRQDRHHQQLHRRVVHWLFALGHLRHVDRF